MEREVTIEETLKALRKMGSDKAPGPNGYPVIFYMKSLHILGSALHEFIRAAIGVILFLNKLGSDVGADTKGD